jgi:hypothetical protein
MITITIQCSSTKEIQADLLQLASLLTQTPPIVISTGIVASAPTPIDDGQKEFDLDVPQDKKKKAKKVKTENKEIPPAPAEEKVKEKPGKPTREAVHSALQQVNSACGLPTARTILSEFKAQRISELKEEFFVGFIAKCNEAVEMQG